MGQSLIVRLDLNEQLIHFRRYIYIQIFSQIHLINGNTL